MSENILIFGIAGKSFGLRLANVAEIIRHAGFSPYAAWSRLACLVLPICVALSCRS